MDFEPLLNWNGWGATGFVVSLTGVLFAFLANSNAKSAKIAATDAAEDVKRTIASVEAISEFGNVLNNLNEIRLKIDGQVWDKVSELCTYVNNSVALVTKTPTFQCSAETRDSLALFQAQIRVLNTSVLKAQHNGGQFDAVKAKKVLFTQSESISAILAELKSEVN